MAIVLIAFGVIIFIAQVNSLSAVKLSMKFWPMILFLLGGEILYFSYKYKGEDVKIKYDVFSVFIVLLIVCINLAIYGFIETGLMSKISSKLSSETFNYRIPYKEVQLDDKIEKIVINGPTYSNLTVRSEGKDKIVFSGSVDIIAESEEKAKESLESEYITTNKSDNILYISFADRANYGGGTYSSYPQNLSLTIPINKKVEINKGSDFELIGESIKNDWIIDNVNRVKLRLKKNSDVKVNAFIYGEESLKGNVKWDIVKIKDETEGIDKVKGELILGSGTNIINILNSDEIVVDEVE